MQYEGSQVSQFHKKHVGMLLWRFGMQTTEKEKWSYLSYNIVDILPLRMVIFKSFKSKSSVRSRRFYLQYQLLRVNFLVWLLKFFSITKCTKIITKSKGSMKLFDSCVSSLINLYIKSYLFFARYKLALVRFYRNHNKLS